MKKPLDQPIAIGRTAEVFAWEDGQVLKLYRDWCPPDWVEREAQIARAVYAAGIPSPLAGEVVEVDGRRGIVYERVDGPDMLEALKTSPLNVAVFARQLAQLHLTMHRSANDSLPSQRGSMVWSIEHAKNLPDDLRRPILKRLEALPDGSQLCHGDFHPANVIISPRGPVIIDWMTAVRGHPAADVARTRLLLTIGDPPQGGFYRLLILAMRGIYFRTYLDEYRRGAPEVVRLSDAFIPIMAAARLNEEIAPERDKLLKLASVVNA